MITGEKNGECFEKVLGCVCVCVVGVSVCVVGVRVCLVGVSVCVWWV